MKLIAGILLIAAVAVSPELRYFRYERPIQGLVNRSGQNCLLVDPLIFPHAAPLLADLRLYHDGTETPFVISTADAAESVEMSITPLNMGVRGGQTVFDASMPDGQYNDLQLALTKKDFIATVAVSGSWTETGSVETKIGSYTIFDLTSQKLGRSTVLHLPGSDFCYLHFRISGPISPENLTGLTVVRLSTIPPKYVTVGETAQYKREGHSSVFEFNLPAHVPVDRISFVPDASPAWFSRSVRISVAPIFRSSGMDTVQPSNTVVSDGSLLRIHSVHNGHRIDEESLEIDVRWMDFRTPTKWTISIDNGDDAPLRFESVQLQMLERNLCFEGDPNAHYALYYGDPALQSPHYDYATLFTTLINPEANASRIAVGPEQPNPAYQPRPDSRPFTEKHPALLWIALAAVIALLGLVALRSVKPPTPSPK